MDASVPVLGRVDPCSVIQLNLIRSKEARLEACLVVVELDDAARSPLAAADKALDALADSEA